jgi:hypothetical protein
MNEVFKPNPIQKHERIRVYRIAARCVLTFGSEAWTVWKTEESRMAAAEMKFMRRMARYSRKDSERNTDIMKELNTEPTMNFIQA